MSYHITAMGAYGGGLRIHADLGGYVPQESDGPWDLDYDHGTEETHDERGDLTDYGDRWEDTWPERVADAVRATAVAEEAIGQWQERNP